MAQNSQYSLDYYCLNDVFYGRVNAQQAPKQPQAAPKTKSHKSSGIFSAFTSSRRSTSSHADAKSSDSVHISSPRSSTSS